MRQFRVFCLTVLFCATSSGPVNFKSSVIEAARTQWENKCLSASSTDKQSNFVHNSTTLSQGCVAYYLHNHKSGGTAICHTALNSGYNITSLEDNCNLPIEVVSADRENRKSGIAQQYILSQPALSFVAQELPPFYPNISNDKYIYLTTIRNPIDRLISHLHHGICTVRTLESAQRLMYNGNCSVTDVRSMTLSELVLDKCFAKDLSWMSTNYYVSMFTGCTPTKKKNTLLSAARHENICSRRHLLLAQNKLHFFSVIVITDTFDDFSRYSKLLELKLSMKFNEELRVGTHENSKEKTSALRNNISAWESLLNVNSLDWEFYTYAKKLASAQLSKELPFFDTAQARLRNSNPVDKSQQLRDALTDEAPFCKFSMGHFKGGSK